MIIDMTRYNFILFSADVPTFLENIREVGLVDITTTDWMGTPAQMELLAKADHYKKTAKAMESMVKSTAIYTTAEQAVQAWDAATERIKELEAAIVKAQNEVTELELWGDFDPALITKLRSQGVVLRFFETSTKSFNAEWAYEYPIEVVAQTATHTYFIVATDETVTLPAIEIKAPTMSVLQKQSEIESYIKEQVAQQAILSQAAASQTIVMAQAIALHEEFDFGKVMTAGESAAEGFVKVIEGWSEKSNTAQIEKFAAAQDVVYFTEDAREENNPPIKLKNNFFARVFEPIGSLYMLPRYNEMDMTPYFAPFFMIFFGMCFGDAGYGLLFIIGILALWKKVPAKFHGFLWLGLYLNIATIFFGLMTGNFCGIELAKLEMFAPVKDYFVSNDSMFMVAVGLGAVQILFGQTLRIFNRAKRGGSFLYGLSSLGWVILFLSSGAAYMEFTPLYTMSSMAYYVTLGIAGFLILFLNSPCSNPFINFGKGVYSFYEQGTGVVGDLISYVRLFAIGLTGAIIAQIFNALSVGLSGDIPVVSWILMAAILLIGHFMTIFISVLGAFVHPVRLTFVEFFKNAEFDGGGRAFNPFRRIKSDE